MSFTVIDPGLASLVVDLGRPRTRSLGVPVGGAADVSSLMLGNGLVGNLPDAPALEITLKGPILRAETEIGCVLFGAPFELGFASRRPKSGHAFTLSPGEELHIAGTAKGLRAYLCVVGGFDSPLVLGSCSALEPLARGSHLLCKSSRVRPRYLPEEAMPLFPDTLRCLPGLQMDWFETSAFFDQEFTASASMNRMGIRLQGKPVTMPARELISEPVGPGAVQVTRDGQCIVLGVDGQTIGGYPKVAQVIQADLDALGQVRPGSKIRFHLVNQHEARDALLKRQAWLEGWMRRLHLSLDAF